MVVEESAIEFMERDHATIFSPVTLLIISLCGLILYHWTAGIEPRNHQVADSGLIDWLWCSVAVLARECGCQF